MTTEKTAEICRCPNRPRFPSWDRGSAAETAAMRRWDAEHGHHDYAKARDTLAQALQYAEGSVSRDEQRQAGEAVLDMVADVYDLVRPSDTLVAQERRLAAVALGVPRQDLDSLPPTEFVSQVASEMKAAHDANGSPTDDAP